MRASYHNHTSASDGTVPIAAMVAGARQLGVEVLGISDHVVLSPDGAIPEWSLHPDQVPAHIDELLAQCRQRRICTMPAADAHAPQHLLRDFGRAVELLRAVGYTQVAGFTQRKRQMSELVDRAG